MIRAVIFDWGGVIRRTEDQTPRHELERELGLAPQSISRAVFGTEIWHRAMRGECGATEAWETIAASLGYPAGRAVEFVTRFFAGDHNDERLLALIRSLRGAGLPVALLSNAAPPYPAEGQAVAEWGMAGLFDVQVFSYTVGVLKPDPRMYQAVLAALNMEPAETFFTDDHPANIQAAHSLGMAGVVFGGYDALVLELARLGVR